MARRRGIALGVVCMALCGCEPPPGMVSSAPPGTELERKPPATETPAEALGEQTPKSGASGASAVPPDIAKIEPATPTAKGETKTTPSGVKYETLTEGAGPEA